MLARSSPLSILALSLLIPGLAHAGVVIDATRVIYPANSKEVSVSLRNTGNAPSLVQSWTDAGDVVARPGETKTPFVLTPPLFRLDPTKGQTLRLIYTREPLAADRETVFWLNVLDIPPRTPADPNAPNRLEMAFRHRLKILFRPSRLSGKPADAAKAVIWSVVGEDGKAMLEARNPTPYFVSFNFATVSAGVVSAVAAADMVAPFSVKRFALNRSDFRAAGPVTVDYGFIDDFGGSVSGSASASLAAD